jgi:threonine/homoserine/homoserine lactone efflux protein
MELTVWLSVATICALGAMSPGPSLAVVVRNTVNGSRTAGVATALGHGAGVALYAFLTATGLAVLITSSPAVYDVIRWAGAAVLAYLGLKALLAPAGAAASLAPEGSRLAPGARGAREGFLIAFVNPKIAVFFLALFSQFVSPDAGWGEKGILTATAGGIDALWYALVALALSRSGVLERLRARATILDRVTGAVLLAFAVRVAI